MTTGSGALRGRVSRGRATTGSGAGRVHVGGGGGSLVLVLTKLLGGRRAGSSGGHWKRRKRGVKYGKQKELACDIQESIRKRIEKFGLK